MPSPRAKLPSASILIASVVTACASLPGLGADPEDQLTAALTDLGESTVGAVALETARLRPFELAPEGNAEPVVTAVGRHSDGWVDAMLDAGLADRLCDRGDNCEPSTELTVIGLSTPYDGRAGAFVDARVRSVTATGGGQIHTTDFVRLQMVEESTGWRVVASTPLWETMR